VFDIVFIALVPKLLPLWHQPTFLQIDPFRVFSPTFMPLAVSFQKMDPYLGAVIIGAELLCAGANSFGACLPDVSGGPAP
jgi:hypothetical protein